MKLSELKKMCDQLVSYYETYSTFEPSGNVSLIAKKLKAVIEVIEKRLNCKHLDPYGDFIDLRTILESDDREDE